MPPDPAIAPPEAQPVPPSPIDPSKPPVPSPLSPDDDPNLKLQRMVSLRGEKKPTEAPKEEPKKPEETPKGDIKKVTGLIGKALGFREDKPAKQDKKEEKPAEPEAKEPEKKEGEPKEPPKTIVKPKKAAAPAAQAADPVKIATAAATAAVKAAMPEAKPAVSPPAPAEESLKSEDRHEYEIAKYLAETNPRYKDAPRIVLEHVRKAEAYASAWEKENKGKVFDPNNDEHDEFFSALEKPWSDHEFRNAEIEMAAERVAERKNKGAEDKIRELESENARNALAPVIDRTYTAAAGLLAQRIGDGVHEKMAKTTFEKFAEEDPITAGALTAALSPLQPIIETAIQLDDPKGRFRFDPKNESHLEWNRIMLEKESQLAGADDGSGKTMVSRAEYSAMTRTQRGRHWYLTTEHLIEEMVNDAAGSAKKIIEAGHEQVKKMALAMGYVPKSADGEIKIESPPPKKPEKQDNSEIKPEAVKPVSPTAGGASKIDDRSAGPSSGSKRLLESTANILFGR